MPFREEKKTPRNKWLDLLMTATVGLFLITCVTGLLLLCGVGKGVVNGVHEWLSVGFVAAGLLHALRHGSIILRYAKSLTFWATTAIVLVLTTAFVVPSLNRGGGRGPGPGGPGGPGGNAMWQVMQTLEEVPLASLAGLVNTSPDALVFRLREAGATVAGPEQSLREIAQSSGGNPQELMALVFSQQKPD